MAGKATDLIEYETMLLGRHFTMTARSIGREGHLDSSTYVLLTRIRLAGPLSLRQLSETFGLDVSTLNRKTSALVRDGLLERISDAEGGIARKFRLTAEGERLLDFERNTMVSGLEKILGDWTPEDVAAFAAYLKRFNTTIEHLAGRPWPRP
ncbi:MarR family winged helix-turn-helix transcriptional regulator [Yinghuangia sp. YIM S10712]|uniref:MarR family winged helix-turn-helix transcriptional regulator n=1 Tax=Yinghuangia sp. YIM S10712 TaxID=3436930 RepID=UPI003F53CB27